MNTVEIQNIATKDPCLRRLFLGVFSSDTVPEITAVPSCFIANTDPSNKPGEHWVAMYFSSRTVEYFDSYGLPPQTPFCDMYDIDVYNVYCLQDLDTNVCGEYCIYYLMKRVRGYDLSCIVDYLRQRSETNDSIVSSYIKRLRNSQFIDGQTCITRSENENRKRCCNRQVREEA